jgi:hypothetical protein
LSFSLVAAKIAMSLKRFFNCSVPSFSVDKCGPGTLVNCKPTRNPVKGKSGTAKSLAYSAAKDMLNVVHSFGPDHLRLMTVDGVGKLTARMGGYLTGKNSTQGDDR